MMNARHILLAEDDQDFALLVQLGFQEAGIFNPITTVADGQEAIRYFNGEGRYADRASYPLPALAMIDVRLGPMTGFQLLEWIRKQSRLKDVRVVLLSSFGSDADAALSQTLGADCYMPKPFKFQDLVESVKKLNDSCLSPNPILSLPSQLEQAPAAVA